MRDQCFTRSERSLEWDSGVRLASLRVFKSMMACTAERDKLAQPAAKVGQLLASTLGGSYAFEWTRGKRGCVKIDPALVKKLDSAFVCRNLDPEDAGTASGKALQAKCEAKKGRSEYLVFKTSADCTAEKETQAANGE